MGDSESLGSLLDHAQDKIVLVDATGEVTYANDSVRRLLGLDPSELVGRSAFERIHPVDVEKARAAFERTVSSDAFSETTVTYRYETADGSWVWLESQMSNLTDDEHDGYVVSSRDVTDRVRAERDQAATARRLGELAATTGDVLWMFNADWSEILFVNPADERVYGGDVDELRENPSVFLETIHEDDVPRVLDAMERLSAGESVDIEYRVSAPAADAGWVWVQAEPVFEDDEVVRITGFARDVTDRRRRERQLYVLDTLLRHDLRSDLTLVLGEAERIAEETPDASERTAVIREAAVGLLESAEKGREIVDLLTGEHSRGEVDLLRAVERAVERIATQFPHATIDVDASSSAMVHAVDGVEVAFAELVENAVKHSEPTEPTVNVVVSERDDQVVVTIEDDAPPLPAVETTVLSGEGEMHDVYHASGLGLWLVHWLVELSNGEITVDPGVDGNRIVVRFERANG